LKETKSPVEYSLSDAVYECKIDADGTVSYRVFGANEAFSESFPICNNLLVVDPADPEDGKEDSSDNQDPSEEASEEPTEEPTEEPSEEPSEDITEEPSEDTTEEESEESTEKTKKKSKKKTNTTPEPEKEKELDDVPKTGDSFPVLIFVVLAVVSAAGMFLGFRGMKKEDNFDIRL